MTGRQGGGCWRATLSGGEMTGSRWCHDRAISLFSSSLPPWASIKSLTSGKSQAGAFEAAVETVVDLAELLLSATGISAGAIPMPVSLTVISKPPVGRPIWLRRADRPPGGVNLHRVGQQVEQDLPDRGGHRLSGRRPASSDRHDTRYFRIAGLWTDHPAPNCGAMPLDFDRVVAPASTWLASSPGEVEDVVDQTSAGAGPLSLSSPRHSPGTVRSPSGPWISVTIRSAKPMMAFSGVRSSWLMLARKCDFAWLAAAAAFRVPHQFSGRRLQLPLGRFQFRDVTAKPVCLACAREARC